MHKVTSEDSFENLCENFDKYVYFCLIPGFRPNQQLKL